MKSKLFFAMMMCSIICSRLSAQCTANITYQQGIGSPIVYFQTDSFNRDTASADYLATSYVWSFGDGTSGTGHIAAHQYSSTGGWYGICLTKTNTLTGCSGTTCDSAYVNSSNCSTTVSYTSLDSLFSFAESTTGSAPFAYQWSVNGQPYSTASSFDYVLWGVFGNTIDVCATVTDATGCQSMGCVHVTDSIASPVCNTYEAFTFADSTYTFTTSHTGGTPVLYLWTYNGAALADSSSSSITLVLDSAALHPTANVCVTVTDANGCSSTDCIDAAAASACHAYFVIQPDTISGNYIGFNYSTGSYGSNILWNFGDGSTSNSPYPTHNYATPGTYIICLTVGSAGSSCYDTYCDSSFYTFKTDGGPMSQLTIEPTTATGISNVNANAAVSIYPNPVSNELTIATADKITDKKIYDITGQVVYQSKATGNTINVSKLNAGIYVLELANGNTSTRIKFVKE